MYNDYEFSYELSYEHNNESYAMDCEIMYEEYVRDSYTQCDGYEIDDEYRDTYDVQELAYRHYA